jgi:hypothetical protein
VVVLAEDDHLATQLGGRVRDNDAMGTALAILVGAIVIGIAIARVVGGVRDVENGTVTVRPKRKRYVMRGYGGGKNATSLHPRQAKQGKRIVFIPGVGYRHVRPGKKR